ncbi:hypothetical protein [Streptomyces sp. NPDC051183]|uniref:hypothetical protein n=1 Tax=Streptomyces sp. NPDC051183 TaxID=3155165 RepID=UPI003441C142
MRATFRTAAVAAGAVTALALPAAHAFAADAPTTPSTPSTPSAPTTPSASPSEETKREDAGTQQLGDGWYAKVFKHVNNGPTKEYVVKGYEAEIHQGKGGVKATLKAFGKPDSKKVGEHTFTLSADGKVTATKDAAKPKPKPEGTKVSGVYVGGGTMADLTNTAADGPKAVLKVGPKDAANGTKAGTVQATLTKKNPRAENNGQKFEIVKADSAKPQLKVTLEGEGTKYYDFPAADKGTTGTRPAQPTKPVTPKGGVKAGAEGVETPGSGDGTLLVAGGAGLAAAGAAGLGFAMLRRHRAEG